MHHVFRLSEIDQTLRTAWIRAVALLNLNATLGPEWLDVVARTLAPGPEAVSVYVETDKESVARAIVPFFVTNTRFYSVSLSTVQLAANLMSYHAEIVCEDDLKDLLRRLVDRVPKWDILQIDNVVAGSRTDHALRSLSRELGSPLQVIPGDVSPYLPIEETWETFVARQKKRFRYNLRHRRELIQNTHGSHMAWYDAASDMDVLLRDMLTIEKVSWKTKSGIDMASKPTEQLYYSELLPWLAKQHHLLANVLYLEQRPIAYSLNCHFGGWVGHLKTSFDESLGHLSPGAVVIDASVQRAFEIGATEFDFLGAADAHKLAWTPFTRSHSNYFLFAPRLKPMTIGILKLLKGRLSSKYRSAGKDHISDSAG